MRDSYNIILRYSSSEIWSYKRDGWSFDRGSTVPITWMEKRSDDIIIQQLGTKGQLLGHVRKRKLS